MSMFSHRTAADLLDINPVLRSEIVDFAPYAVFNILRGVKCLENISSLFWINLALVLAFPISIIFTSSYKHAIGPRNWKCALVLHLFKKGDANFR